MWCPCVKKNKCGKCGNKCEHPNYEEVGWLIDTVEDYIVQICIRQQEYKRNGFVYGCCKYDPKEDGKDISCLLSYLKVLKKVWGLLQMGGQNSCTCFDNYACLKDKILRIVGKIKMNLSPIKVEKIEGDWLVNNPGMTTFERWERCIHVVMPVFEFLVKEKQVDSMEFIYEATLKEDTREYLYSAVEKKSRELNVEFNTSLKDESIDLEYKSKETKKDLGFSASTKKKKGRGELKFSAVDKTQEKEIKVSAKETTPEDKFDLFAIKRKNIAKEIGAVVKEVFKNDKNFDFSSKEK